MGDDAPAPAPAADAPAPAAADAGTFTSAVIPEKKPRLNVYWNRPRTHLYDYNYDYSSYYYRPLIDYIDRRNNGYRVDIPRPQTWAERALTSYLNRARRDREMYRYSREYDLLHSMRNSSYQYFAHTKAYSRRVTNTAY